MLGVIDVGGGLRGIYGAAIFDLCMEEGISFDYLIGVSAGAANCASFLAGQHGRNIRFYAKYSFRPEYMSLKNLIRTGSYLDLDYIYGDGLSSSKGEDPIRFDQMIRSGKEFKIVATDAMTGKPIYYDMGDMEQDDYGAIKGSSCVPLASRPCKWRGRLLYDGGISDPIPFRYALQAGCDRIVVILTRPKTYRRDGTKDKYAARLLRFKYPKAAEALAKRAELYNSELEHALTLEAEGKLLILAPEDINGMDTLSKDRESIKSLYHQGRRDARAALAFMRQA